MKLQIQIHIILLLLMILLNNNLILCQSNLASQNLKAIRRQKLNSKLRGSENNNSDSNKLFNTLTIKYPLHIFNLNSKDWKKPGEYDEELLETSKNAKNYLDLSLAQDQEDVWLYENWFYGMKNGIIMESGALDGVLFSTSYFFEEFANFQSIHVEADPENYKNLINNRENAININGALCSEPKLLHYSSEGVIPVRGFVEFMTPSFLKKWHGKIYKNITQIDSLPTVQCLPVKSLLREINVKHIDIWILDTEGSEESVLKGVDFNLVHFNAVAMECDAHDLEKNKRKTDILENNNFKCILVERNCMCKHNNFISKSAPVKSELYKFDGLTHSRSKVYSNTNKDTS